MGGLFGGGITAMEGWRHLEGWFGGGGTAMEGWRHLEGKFGCSGTSREFGGVTADLEERKRNFLGKEERMVDLRIKVSFAMIPCRKIETLKMKKHVIHRRRYKVYIEDKVGIWVTTKYLKPNNNPT